MDFARKLYISKHPRIHAIRSFVESEEVFDGERLGPARGVLNGLAISVLLIAIVFLIAG